MQLQMIEEEADIFMERDEVISARDSYLMASMYYRAAEYFGFFSESSRRKNWEKSRECFQNAAKFFEALCEVIEVQFEDMKLPDYFIKPEDDLKKRPTLLIMSGFDGTAEELYFYMGAELLTEVTMYCFLKGRDKLDLSICTQKNHFDQIMKRP
ncbi:hypothetical protein [Methanobacterium veterum]|jgi:hypothetical protein|nr:hypothetical protein [Methanobacterium veterum]MCZ3364696.1 hypothetical protein [Methanobacterium veterum]